MSEGRLTILAGGVVILVGTALYRVFGAVALSFLVLALISLNNTYRLRRDKERRRLVANFRSRDPEAVPDFVAKIDDLKMRRAVQSGLGREGTVERDGTIERFPFPASFARSLNVRYWFFWAVGFFLLVVAALTSVPTLVRLVLLGIGLLSAVKAWRSNALHQALASTIEITPTWISESWPSGSSTTVLFAAKPLIVRGEDGESFLIGHSSQRFVYVSRHRLAFERLARLCREHGGIERSNDSPT